MKDRSDDAPRDDSTPDEGGGGQVPRGGRGADPTVTYRPPTDTSANVKKGDTLDATGDLERGTTEPPTVAAASPARSVAGRQFGDYDLLEEIARGGMGVVYKARQRKLNRIVAVKMILAGQFASPEHVQRFYSEAEAAANLDHPGIVPIYEVHEQDGQHFFSMGFVDGESLAERVRRGPLPAREAAQLTWQIAAAIQYDPLVRWGGVRTASV